MGQMTSNKAFMFKTTFSLANIKLLKPLTGNKSTIARSIFSNRKHSQLTTLDMPLRGAVKRRKQPRKRSIDLITDKCKNYTSVFVSSESNTQANCQSVTTFRLPDQVLALHQGHKEMNLGARRSRIYTDHALGTKRSSTIFPIMRKDRSFEKRAIPKKQINAISQATDERILAYLKQTLSSMITDSVYLKEFYKLFNEYRTNSDKSFQYRSKSVDDILEHLSNRKRRVVNKCLFSEHVYNLYLRFNLIRQQATRNPYIMAKNTILFSELDKKPAPNDTAPHANTTQIREHLTFNFLTVIKPLKEFVYAIRHFNTTKQLKYTEIHSINKLKYKAGKTRLATNISSKQDLADLEAHIIAQPVNNIRTANMFQQLVQHTVIKEKQVLQHKEIRTKIANCLRRSFYFIKRDLDKRKADENSHSKFKSKTVAPNKTLIDVKAVFKLPKTTQLQKLTISLKNDLKTVSKNFRLKNFNLKTQNVQTPYTCKPRLDNYL